MSDLRDRIEKLSPKRLALLALELQDRVDELERQRNEPVAVVGIGCRIPGAEPGPAGFWKLLIDGKDAITLVPENRWDASQYYDANPDVPGRMSTQWGSFLAGVDLFDASFFGISRREAVSMDPQQRILLEVSWEALEHAGLSPRDANAASTGVFVGISTTDYNSLLLSRGEEPIDAYFATGTAHSIAGGRISYSLGFHGPNLAIDTACSASLVAVHLACQSLRSRECRQALAGGVNAILSPEVTIALSKARMMAADGRCKAFDAAADGFVRGEGCGIVVLKRLSDAQADGDRILALIRGSAVNQDGRSGGVTVPSGVAQESVIRQALANAGVAPHEVSYVEAHGTGTALGDPIEAHALAAVLGAGRNASDPLILGTVKTNVGHLEAAAGVTGLIKTVLALHHKQIPGNLHFHAMNPQIDWSGMPLDFPTSARPWPEQKKRKLAGVSSFGFSGTNAHVILEDAPAAFEPKRPVERPLHILALSARSETALENLRAQYMEVIGRTSQQVGDICFTADAGRAHFDYRLAVSASSAQNMAAKLGEVPSRHVDEPENLRVAFLFSGQGSQYAGMGKQLFETQPVFRSAMEACADLLRDELDETLPDLLWGKASGKLDQTIYAQPCLFAIEYALSALWKSWGVRPSAVLGHSVGEYAAACVAGVFSLADGLKLIAARGRMMQAVAGQGTMSAVAAGEQRVRVALQGLEGRVSIAALNAPESVVISGYQEQLRIAEQRLQAAGIRVARLAVSHAFHSPQMHEMESAFETTAAQISITAPRVGLVSSVTGRFVARHELNDPSYWRRQINHPVRFQHAMETLKAEGYTLFLEVGPGSTLLGLGRQCLGSDNLAWLASLKSSKVNGAGQGDEWTQILDSLGALYARGAEVDWAGFDQPYSRRRVTLPTYPFERKRYWFEDSSRAHLPKGQTPLVYTSPASATLASSESQVPADWWYRLAWKRSPVRGTIVPHDQLPDPTQAATTLSSRASELSHEAGFDRYAELNAQLDIMSAAFIGAALQRAGWNMEPGERASLVELQSRLGIVEAHRPLFRRLISILEEENVLRHEGDLWTVVRAPAAQHSESRLAELAAQYPAFHGELTLLGRCGASLAEVLRGTADPIQLLFPSGAVDTAAQVYSDSPGPRVFNQLAVEAIRAEIKARPDGMIRVLEVGAGTGGTTTWLAKVLPAERTEYTFTDVSPRFTARASQMFQQYPFFSYKTLDIERDPAAQGIELGAYDIVVAANVLHATQDLRTTMQNVRKLLAPSGLLILLEGTAPERWVDLTFGLTEGWWRFRDFSLRPSYPLISRAAWLDLLEQEGFTNVGAAQPAGGSQQALFLGRAGSGPAPAKSRWLLIPDQRGFARTFADKLNQHGGEVVFANADQPLDKSVSKTAFDHVVHLSSLDQPASNDLTTEALTIGQDSPAVTFLAAAQTLVRSQNPPRLWLITRGAQSVLSGEAPSGLAQAPCWGLAKTIALEHPDIGGGAVDLDPAVSDQENAASLFAAIIRRGGADHLDEDQCAFRGGLRYVARLERREPLPARIPSLRSESLYLITGGLGGLGLKVAKWLVERGARRLVLLSRSGLPEGWRDIVPTAAKTDAIAKRIAAVRELETMGAEVQIVAADVADAAAMRALFATFAPGELKGIVHAAAAPDSCLIENLTPEKLALVMRPKVEGTWLLHTLSEAMQLDFFALFSSWASLLGARELAHYVAANQFMDGLAHYRRNKGLPAVAINWAAWDEISAASDSVLNEYARGGLRFMQSEWALSALGSALQGPDAQVAIAAVDWAVLKPLYESRRRRPLLEQVANLPSSAADAQKKTGVLIDLGDAGPEERFDLILNVVRGEVATVLRIASEEVDVSQGLFELGMDSLMSVELKGRLETCFERTLPSTLTFSHPNVRALVKYLDQQLRQSLPVRNDPAGQDVESEEDTEDELAARLAAALQEME